jgi:hypothetical protein
MEAGTRGKGWTRIVVFGKTPRTSGRNALDPWLSTLDPINVSRFQSQSIRNATKAVHSEMILQHPLHLVEIPVVPDFRQSVGC